MSYIEQNVFLFNASIRENILLGEDFTEEQLRKAIHDSALENDLMSMPNGLDTLVGEGGCNISGGQKQRVAIARALIHNRSILLVDEGTSALDAQNADRVEKSLLANPNLTLILIAVEAAPWQPYEYRYRQNKRILCSLGAIPVKFSEEYSFHIQKVLSKHTFFLFQN